MYSPLSKKSIYPSLHETTLSRFLFSKFGRIGQIIQIRCWVSGRSGRLRPPCRPHAQPPLLRQWHLPVPARPDDKTGRPALPPTHTARPSRTSPGPHGPSSPHGRTARPPRTAPRTAARPISPAPPARPPPPQPATRNTQRLRRAAPPSTRPRHRPAIVTTATAPPGPCRRGHGTVPPS